MELQLYTISDQYVTYAHSMEPKVSLQDTYEGERDYCGIILQQGQYSYFAPLSSYNPDKETKMKKRTRIIIRLFEKNNPKNRLGYILLNNMLPVPTSEVQQVHINLGNGIPKERMLLNQYLFISDDEVSQRIEQKAKTVYRKRCAGQDDFYNTFCNDFKLLEEKMPDFKK